MKTAVRCALQPTQCGPRAQQQQQQQPKQQILHVQTSSTSRRQWLMGLGAAAAAAALPAAPAAAVGLESFDLPAVETPEAVTQLKARNQQVLDDAEAAFQNSDLLRTLKERSDANRASNKRALQDKYCQRQGEMGVGDCGGLRFIPGMTKNGVQKRPEWLNNLLGLESQ